MTIATDLYYSHCHSAAFPMRIVKSGWKVITKISTEQTSDIDTTFAHFQAD